MNNLSIVLAMLLGTGTVVVSQDFISKVYTENVITLNKVNDTNYDQTQKAAELMYLSMYGRPATSVQELIDSGLILPKNSIATEEITVND